MKKDLPCRFKAILLTLCAFVAFIATSTTVFAQQVCTQSETLDPVTLQPAQFVCAGGDLLWRTTTFNPVLPDQVRWHIVADQSGGAVFALTGNANDLVAPAAGISNTVLVHFGPLAGSVEIRMSYESNPLASGCASSGTAVRTLVTATPSIQACANDTGTITAVATTLLKEGTAPVSIGVYTYVLQPGGATNTTGIFSGLAPGPYTVTATSLLGCQSAAFAVDLINPAVVPVNIQCPVDVHDSACKYANQDEVNAAYLTWLNTIVTSGGTGVRHLTVTPLTTVPPNACGGVAQVKFDVIDDCGQTNTCTATFEILPLLAPRVNEGDVFHLGACLNQGDIDAAFVNFLASVTAVSDCGPINVTHDEAVRPDKCLGGDVPVTFRIISRCFDEIDVVKHFIVDAPAAPTIICAANAAVACGGQFVHTPPTGSGGCGALTVNLISTVVSIDGKTSTATWDVTDACGRHSAQCSQVLTKQACLEIGCTLGYWKNHTLAWCSTYKTCDKYGTIFTHAPANLKDLTLLQALGLNGNTDCENLARQSVAALLNICQGLPFHIATVGELQNQVNAAFDAGTCNALGAQLDTFNSAGGAQHCNVPFSPNNKKDQCTAGAKANTLGVIDNTTAKTTEGITKFIAYPNPYKSNFRLEIQSNSIEPMNITVYDMLGKRIETKNIKLTETDNIYLGEGYPIGIYNVILNQATETKTIRVIKGQ
jgi:hypothetical protein